MPLRAAKHQPGADEVHVLVQVTNQDPEGIRYVALYDKNYRWTKSTLADRTGKIHDVTDVVFLEGDKKVTMYEKGKHGMELPPQGSTTVRLVFKDVPGIDRSGLNLNPFRVRYYRPDVGTTWQEGKLPMRGIRLVAEHRRARRGRAPHGAPKSCS
jgi:hypothetical protein